MKTFLKNLWIKFVALINKFNWKIKFIFKGIKGDNIKYDKTWLLIPSLFGHNTDKEIEIGFIWFGFGIKLVISKKAA